MKLSILICTLTELYRDQLFIKRLLSVLEPQKTDDIEILIESDDKQMSVGEKRNKLLNRAIGERVVFVDDDDLVTDDYIEKLLEYCKLDFDCVTIGVEYLQDGKNRKVYDYSFNKNINFRDAKRGPIAGRMPNHLCLWKKEVAQRVKFPDRSLGEDHEWAQNQLLKGYTIEHKPEIIYSYLFSRANTQTRNR